MNNTFSINRLFKIIKSDIIKYSPNLYIIFAVFISIPIISVLFHYLFDTGIIDVDSREQNIMFFNSVLVFLAPFLIYKDVNNKKLGVDYTMLPASVLEKYISMVFIIMILVPILYFISYLALDSILALIFSSFYKGYLINNIFNNDFINYVWKCMLYASTGIAGNLFFRKHKIGKTILSIIILSIFFVYIFFLSMRCHIENIQKISNSINANIENIEYSKDSVSNSETLDSSKVLVKSNKANISKLNSVRNNNTIVVKKNHQTYIIKKNQPTCDLFEYIEDTFIWIKIIIYVLIPGILYGLAYYKLRYQQF